MSDRRQDALNQKWRDREKARRETGKKASKMDYDDLRRQMQRELERSIMGGSRSGFSSISIDRIEPPRPRSKEEMLDAELQQARSLLREQDALLKRLAAGAAPIADVIQVAGATTFISLGGSIIGAITPEFPIRAGDQVKVVGETMQIKEKIAAPIGLGEITTVLALHSEELCEVRLAGSTRIVVCKVAIEAGDRVVLDRTGQVVVRRLGQPETSDAASDTGVTWDDIAGLEETKRELREAIELPYTHRDVFAKYGQKPARGVLLYGPPGCGKSMLARAVSSSVAAIHGARQGGFIYIKGPEILDKFVGASEENVRAIFDKARIYKRKHGVPAVVFIDEADAILCARGTNGGLVERTIVPQFLAEMDGLEDSGAFVLLATNRPDSLDPAVVRDGRIDRRIRVPRPDRVGARAIFDLCFAGRPVEGDRDELAESAVSQLFSETRTLFQVECAGGNTHPFTLAHVVNGAMIAGIVQRATQSAIRRELGGGGDSGIQPGDIADAIARAHAEQKDIDQREAVGEFIEQLGHPVARIVKGRQIHAASN